MHSFRLILFFIIFTALLAATGLVSPSWLREILLSTILSVDAFIIIIYMISRLYYRPRISLIVGGQQSGTPVPLPSNEGMILLGVTTDLKKEVVLEEVRVEYDDNRLDLSWKEDLATEELLGVTEKGTAKVRIRERFDSTDGIPERMHGQVTRDTPLDHKYPEALVLSGLPKVRADFIHVYGLRYKSMQEEFSFLVRVISKLEEYEIGPPWDMFTFGSHRYTQSISFKVDADLNMDNAQRLLRYGFELHPRKTIIMSNIPHAR